MRLRSGRHLVSPLTVPQGGHHHRQRLRGSDDRIDSLPKDLLLQVLVRLKHAERAACVGAVCRSWHGLWIELPELTFGFVKPRMLEAVLAKVKRGAQVSLLLRAATRLVPEKLMFHVWNHLTLEDDPIELPCFDRTSSLALEVMGFHLLPPLSGEFTALKSLSLSDCRGIDIGALLPLCPSLRVLNMYHLVEVGTMMVHSASLEELNLETKKYWLHPN
uniref:F-box domain-containing protein n=1 Tax=Setaria italica TaxID=4555 RepID=K3XZ96_SETIT